MPGFPQAVSLVFKGIVASVVASFLFGAIYYLSPWLAPLAGEEIFGWRVLCTLPFTTLLLWGRGEAARGMSRNDDIVHFTNQPVVMFVFLSSAGMVAWPGAVAPRPVTARAAQRSSRRRSPARRGGASA